MGDDTSRYSWRLIKEILLCERSLVQILSNSRRAVIDLKPVPGGGGGGTFTSFEYSLDCCN